MDLNLTTFDYMDIEEAINASCNYRRTLESLAEEYEVSTEEFVAAMERYEEGHSE